MCQARCLKVVELNGKELWKLWRPKMAAMSIFVALQRIAVANAKLKADAAKNPPKLKAGAKPPRGGPRGARPRYVYFFEI